MQLNHYNSPFKEHQFSITIVCNQVTNAPNVGSLFRIADAFGVKEIMFCGQEIPLGRKMTKTSRATENYVNYKISEDAFGVITALKANKHKIIGLEITSKSLPLHQYKISTKDPIVLLIGDENHGISADLLNLCDDVVHIDMYGQNSSMNVVQATSIALYEFTKQLL